MNKGMLGPIAAAIILVVGFHGWAQTDEPGSGGIPAWPAAGNESKQAGPQPIGGSAAVGNPAWPGSAAAPVGLSTTGGFSTTGGEGMIVPSKPIPTVTPAGPSLAAANDMIGFTRELASGNQAITLINASRKWMAVYHVDQSGQIHLVSSRPLDADFSFQFNATAPLPEEIRKLQGR